MVKPAFEPLYLGLLWEAFFCFGMRNSKASRPFRVFSIAQKTDPAKNG